MTAEKTPVRKKPVKKRHAVWIMSLNIMKKVYSFIRQLLLLSRSVHGLLFCHAENCSEVLSDKLLRDTAP